MSEKEDFLYDEDESVKFIQNYLPQELKGKFSNDDINYIVVISYRYTRYLILYYPFVKLQIKQNSIEAESEGVVLE